MEEGGKCSNGYFCNFIYLIVFEIKKKKKRQTKRKTLKEKEDEGERKIRKINIMINDIIVG